MARCNVEPGFGTSATGTWVHPSLCKSRTPRSPFPPPLKCKSGPPYAFKKIISCVLKMINDDSSIITHHVYTFLFNKLLWCILVGKICDRRTKKRKKNVTRKKGREKRKPGSLRIIYLSFINQNHIMMLMSNYKRIHNHRTFVG